MKREGEAGGDEETGGDQESRTAAADAGSGVEGEAGEKRQQRSQQQRQRRHPRDRPGFFAPRVFHSPRKSKEKPTEGGEGGGAHLPAQDGDASGGEGQQPASSTDRGALKPKRKNRKPRRRRSRSKSGDTRPEATVASEMNGGHVDHQGSVTSSPHDAQEEQFAGQKGRQQPRVRRGGYRYAPRLPLNTQYGNQRRDPGFRQQQQPPRERDGPRQRQFSDAGGNDDGPLAQQPSFDPPTFNQRPTFYGNSFDRNREPGGLGGGGGGGYRGPRGGFRGRGGYYSNSNRDSGGGFGGQMDGERRGGSFRGGYSGQRHRQQQQQQQGGGFPRQPFDYPHGVDPIPVSHESAGGANW